MAALDELRLPPDGLQASLGKDSHSSGHYSESQSSQNDTSSGYINDYNDDITTSCCDHTKRYSIAETVDTNFTVEMEYSSIDKYPKMVDPERVPWSEQEVLNSLREGRTSHLSGHITVEIMQHTALLLQRPLMRITREAQRLSQTFCRCGREEISAAIKIVLARPLADRCLQACHKAAALYSMSGDTFKKSKSNRCGLHFSVGKFHRWMLDSGASLRIQEFAAIYLTACMEALLEEYILMSIGNEVLGDKPFKLDVVEAGISGHPELWGLIQPYEHLVCGRTGSGTLSLPSGWNVSPVVDPAKVRGRRPEKDIRTYGQETPDEPFVKNIEQCLLATCVGSLKELGDLVTKAMHYWYKVSINQSSCYSRQTTFTWSAHALYSLYYYMRCGQLEHVENPNIVPPSIHLYQERPYAVMPPLLEWIRVATAHAEYRKGRVIDADDVRQTARLLLPGCDCPPRLFGPDGALCMSTLLDPKSVTFKFQQDLAFQMLGCGRSDILPEALMLLGPGGINTVNEQGLTPLMYACICGDEAMVQMLVDAGAALDISVPTDLQRYPCVHSETCYWTALTFATAMGHIAIVQLLLEQGANVEGSVKVGEENYSETPLQLSSSAGQYEIVALLLSKGANPYLNTVTRNGVSYTYTRGGYSAFALAAAHGHRNILRKLLNHPLGKSSDVVSIHEVLSDSSSDSFKNKYNSKMTSLSSSSDFSERDSCSDFGDSEKEDIYVTIDDVIYKDAKLQAPTGALPLHAMSRGQALALQEALYHAAENGFLDIALELRNMGVGWSLHTWHQCLIAAYNMRRRTIIQCLLKDFGSVRAEVLTDLFVCEVLPAMFDVFVGTKNETTGQLLSNIFSSLVVTEQTPPIKEIKLPVTAKIDARYINNPELSDVQFQVDGRLFYAHKIILAHASSRFKGMLASATSSSSSSGISDVTDIARHNVIEIADVRYHIFEYVMNYLYNGGAESMKIPSADILELMAAAHFFMLDGLLRHCEILCTQKITPDNCIALYKHAKMYNARALTVFCEAYFMQRMSSLLTHNDEFRKMVYSSKLRTFDLPHGLLEYVTKSLSKQQQKLLLQQQKESQLSTDPPPPPPVGKR